jgi:ketosteroid isomerase-like protein
MRLSAVRSRPAGMVEIEQIVGGPEPVDRSNRRHITLEARVKTPLELLQTLLSNPTNIEHVRGLTTEDVTYVSLNFNNPELHKVLPWTGINRGPQSIVDVFNGIGRVWETKAFEVKDVIANEHSVAMFGSFTYKTRTLGKEITSPFALLAKVTGDKISYIQFMEDTFGTASSFRASGTWHFRGVATGEEVSVGS